MKKLISFALVLMLALSVVPAYAANFTPGEYEGSAAGFGGVVTVKVTVDENAVQNATISETETPTIGGQAAEKLCAAMVGVSSADEVEAVAGATVTSGAVKEALAAALSAAKGEAKEEAALAFTAGTYTASAKGYNAPVEVSVTFSENAVTAIEVTAHKETAHVGDVAFAPMIEDMLAANGAGVDAVAGATFSSAALRNAVIAAAEQAGCTNMSAFKTATVKHEAQAPVEGTWDVVIVGAGGAGLAAAAQAAQDGNTVLLIEKAAEMGGNTLVSGGAYQSVMPYLVWDPADPEATTGVNPIDGQTYDKVLNDKGRIEILKVILDWDEKEFDGTVDAEHPFVAGEIGLNAVRGVHAEYLPVLQELKSEIKAYLDWAQPKLDAGAKETDLAVFSTLNLHIFQTYYGGLRPNADNSEWIYGDVELVKQFVEGGQDIKPWLCAQGSLFEFNRQFTLIGCLWQRENAPLGGVVDGVTYDGAANTKWGAYFLVPYNTMINANEHNEMMLRTEATDLIVEDGKVTGVKAVKFDGTEVTAHATKGVILATGGYAANIEMVQQTNKYWDPSFIADNIGTTNRSAMTGDGIRMAQAVGAAFEGEGWTQMMPLGWVDNGNLSRGAGENVIFVNAATGMRYVDESAERDVLSLGGFQNGMSKEQAEKMGLKYVPGIYIEISNHNLTSVNGAAEIEGRQYFRPLEEVAEMIGCDAETLRNTIVEYDNYVMGLTTELSVPKLATQGTIGDVEKDENGNYLPETYKLDVVRMRPQAPSTHHTMGGLKVDTDRHVIDVNGNVIPGLFAAGEVTGGNHAGNRLGGNAVTEIIVSGRVAAQGVNK
ncbi:MAG: FAD-dependent oxidoreductase [Clostridia bacterium]|nr:FAD-dependent oxidoreductase [Clostridia bacterium]